MNLKVEGLFYSELEAVAKVSSGRPWCYLFRVLVGVVLICAIALPINNIFAICFIFERNYNEGWNVYNTQRLIDHEVIYDANYWRVNNYPIVSFIVTAAVNTLIHDPLLSGRIVALMSFVAVGLLAATATRRFGGDRIDAIFGGSCALGFCYLVAPAWVAVDDPETLAEALMLGGLVTYIAKPEGRFALFRTALLVTLGGFTKHNVVAIPLAITLDLMIRRPRRLLFWLTCWAGTIGALLSFTNLVAGGTFIGHLLSPRIFMAYGVRYHFLKYLRLFEFPLVAIMIFSRTIFSERLPLSLYGVISIAAATILSGFEGTSYNMFQDAAVFLAIASGLMLREVRTRIASTAASRQPFRTIVLAVAPFLVAQPIWARAPETIVQLYRAGDLLEAYRRAERQFIAEAAYVSEKRGAAICESLLLCYRAGQPFTLDPFNSRQYILAGKLDQTELIQRIASREFAVIQLRADICDDPASASCHILHSRRKFNRFTDEVLYAVDRYYQIGWRSQDGTFYVPK